MAGIIGIAKRYIMLATPNWNPSSGEVSFYFKTDKKAYVMDSLGVERPLAPIDMPESALHANPYFETGSTPLSGDGWKKFDNASTTVWTYDVTTFVEGTRSLKLVSTTGDNRFGNSAELTGLTPGSLVTITTRAKASVAGTLYIRFATAPTGGQADYFGSGVTFQDSVPVVVGTDWVKVSHSYVVPAGHTKMRFYLDGQNGRTWWFDNTGSSVQPAPPGDLVEVLASNTSFSVVNDSVFRQPTHLPVLNFTSPGISAVYRGSFSLDAETTTNNTTLAVNFYLDGVQIASPQAVMQGVSIRYRNPLAKEIRLTNLAAGAHTLEARVSCLSTGTGVIYSHSTIHLQRIA